MFSQSVDNQRPQPFREIDEDSPTSNLLQYGGANISSSKTEAEDDPALKVMLWTFWIAAGLNVLAIPVIWSYLYSDDAKFGVFIILTALLFVGPMITFIVNSVFLCMGRVPGRGKLSACNCKRPFCQSMQYAITSAVFLAIDSILIIILLIVIALNEE